MIVNVKFYSVEAGPELLKRGGKRGLALQTHTVGKMIFSPYRHVGSRFLPSIRRAFKFNYTEITFLFRSSDLNETNGKLSTLL